MQVCTVLHRCCETRWCLCCCRPTHMYTASRRRHPIPHLLVTAAASCQFLTAESTLIPLCAPTSSVFISAHKGRVETDDIGISDNHIHQLRKYQNLSFGSSVRYSSEPTPTLYQHAVTSVWRKLWSGGATVKYNQDLSRVNARSFSLNNRLTLNWASVRFTPCSTSRGL